MPWVNYDALDGLNCVWGATAGLDPTDIGNLAFLWHKGDDHMKDGAAIPLMYRMATVADVKPPPGQTFSRYLWKSLATQVTTTFKGCAGYQTSALYLSASSTCFCYKIITLLPMTAIYTSHPMDFREVQSTGF